MRVGTYFLGLLGLGLLAVSSLSAQSWGQLDASFGQGGQVRTSFDSLWGWSNPNQALIQSDGRLLTVTAVVHPPLRPYLILARYLDNGQLDPDWAQGGLLRTEVLQSLTLGIEDIIEQADGKILIAGYRDSLHNGQFIVSCYIRRYEHNGQVDASFGQGGALTLLDSTGFSTNVYKMAIVDDRLLVFSFWTVRAFLGIEAFRLQDGQPDLTWGDNGRALLADTDPIAFPVSDLEVLPDKKLLVPYKGRIYRFLPHGQLDSTFGNNQGYLSLAAAIPYSSSLDPRALGSANGLRLARQSDGKLLVSGIASRYSDYAGYGIVERYWPDGRLDSSFAQNGIMLVDFRRDEGLGRNLICDITCLSDDRFMVVGSVEDTLSGHSYVAINAYSSEGELDSSFAQQGRDTLNFHATDSIEYANRVLVQPDGKIVLFGYTPLWSRAAANNLPIGCFNLARYQGKAALASTLKPTEVLQARIFPNPFHTNLVIETGDAEIARIRVFNNLAQELFNQHYQAVGSLIQLDLGHLPSGSYFLRLEFKSGGREVHPLIKP